MKYYWGGKEFNSLDGRNAYIQQKMAIKEALGMSYEDFLDKTVDQLKAIQKVCKICGDIEKIINDAIKRNGNGLPF